MSGEFSFEEKGNVKPQAKDLSAPEKAQQPLTMTEINNNLNPGTVARMQQTLGNQTVQRFLAQRSGSETAEVDEETASTINSKRGGGHALDEGIAGKAGSVMGQDFSDVNVHTDSSADSLNQQLNAKAFTVGNDVFFRSGEYNPGSESGQHLISHELTHVVQQGASEPVAQTKMTVNDPNDQYEAEADKVADTVMSMPEDVQREEVTDYDEKEEMLATKRADVQRESSDGAQEDELMQKPMDIQRDDAGGMPEEELMQMPMDVQRQEEREDDRL